LGQNLFGLWNMKGVQVIKYADDVAVGSDFGKCWTFDL